MSAFRYSLLFVLALCPACASDNGSRAGSSNAAPRTASAAEAATVAVNAELLGQLLFERYQEPAAASSAIDQSAVSTATAQIGDRCGATYEVILIPASSVPFPVQQIPLKDRSSILAYAIGKASDDQTVLLGPHYRIELGPDGKTVRSTARSTTACTTRSRSELANGSVIDHRPAKAPTEFDVFLSLHHKAKLGVRTAMGTWEIDNGAVDLVAPDPSYRPEAPALVDCKMPDGAQFTTTDVACQSGGGTILD